MRITGEMLNPVKVRMCPFCGSKQIERISGGYLEIGEWDGRSYEEEMYMDGYSCQDCKSRFWVE